jgi:hypothetical protein
MNANITIKSIGPITLAQFEIKPLVAIIGPQSSGKSTIAKLVSFCQWLEKHLILDGVPPCTVQDGLFEFHHLSKEYFSSKSDVLYVSDHVEIHIDAKKTLSYKILKSEGYLLTKNIYIPSERNFVSVIPNLGRYNEKQDNIMNFLYDWGTAKKRFTHPKDILNLPVQYLYDKEGMDIVQLSNAKKKLLLENSSSGLQSLIPLVILLDYLSSSIYKKDRVLSVDERIRLDKLLSNVHKTPSDEILKQFTQYSYTNFIIEEPEQNLFPDTQRDLIYHLLSIAKFRNNLKHKILLTTHSPYILYAINNCLLAGLLEKEPLDEHDKNLPCYTSRVKMEEVALFKIEQGELKSIQTEKHGLLGDHYFNQSLSSTLDEYYQLMDYLYE